jgi:hypothetical protein
MRDVVVYRGKEEKDIMEVVEKGEKKNMRNGSFRVKERVTRKFRREISQHERDV